MWCEETEPTDSPGLNYTGQTLGLPRQLWTQQGAGGHWIIKKLVCTSVLLILLWLYYTGFTMAWDWPVISDQPIKRMMSLPLVGSLSAQLHSVLWTDLTLTVTLAAAGQDPAYDSRTSSARNQLLLTRNIQEYLEPKHLFAFVSLSLWY